MWSMINALSGNRGFGKTVTGLENRETWGTRTRLNSPSVPAERERACHPGFMD